ncbi:MAG: CvpA family protein [Lachnospiraceae bacterium]|nr:CvpA family protein [Lachnospiraceae bacterium]
MKFLIVIPIIYLIIETILGYKRGLVKSVLLLVSWIVSVAGSVLMVREFASASDKLQDFAANFNGIVGPQFSSMAALVFVFVILVIMIKVFCHIIIHFSGVISDIPVVGTANRILGALFGLLKGGIAVGIFFLIYSVYNGMYLDILRTEMPGVMSIIEQVKDYLQQLWLTVA